MRHVASVGLVGLMLAGCALGPAPASTVASKRPTLKASPRAKALVLPRKVHLPLPRSLGGVIGQDGAGLIGQDGGGIVAGGAGNIVAGGAGNIVAGGAGNYALLQEAATPAPAPSCMANAAIHLEEILKLNLLPYTWSVSAVNRVLERLANSGFTPDQPFEFEDPSKPDVRLTAVVTVHDDRTVIRVLEGATQVIGLSFTSADQGRFVFRPVTGILPPFKQLAIASTFDLTQGLVEADGLADVREPGQAGSKGDLSLRAHWVFAAAPAPAPAFALKSSAFFHYVGEPGQSGPRGQVAKFLPDGSAAIRMGRILEAGDTLSFTRENGCGYTPDATDGVDFFWSAQGATLPPNQADDTLKAILPTQADFYRPFPGDPTGGQAFSEPAFAFPE